MKRLNGYTYTTTFIKEGIAFLNNGTIPSRYRFPSRQQEFQQRYAGMRVMDSELLLGDLYIVPQSQINDTLAKLYKETGDIGRDRFYALVKKRHIGISHPQVQAFLNNQELHQLMQQVKKKQVNKAIVTNRPTERWQADLVDVSKYKSPQNSNTTFLLTVIDCFSKFAWVVSLRNKQAATVAAAMKQVLEVAGAKPTTIQTDNGGEFEDAFEKLLIEQGIQHAHSCAYNPQATGQIERFNGTLKCMIYAHMLTNETKTFVPQLAKMVATYNSLYHTGIKQTPTEAHNNKNTQPAVAKQIQSKKQGRHTKQPPVHIGDTVRIALIHQPLEKPVTLWTTELFLVVRIVPPVAAWDAASYVLHDGRKFTQDRLQKVDRLRLVHMQEPKEKQQPTISKQRIKEPVVPRVQPRRERAPSSTMKDTYLDL
jgi:transposase InsO family protein